MQRRLKRNGNEVLASSNVVRGTSTRSSTSLLVFSSRVAAGINCARACARSVRGDSQRLNAKYNENRLDLSWITFGWMICRILYSGDEFALVSPPSNPIHMLVLMSGERRSECELRRRPKGAEILFREMVKKCVRLFLSFESLKNGNMYK